MSWKSGWNARFVNRERARAEAGMTIDATELVRGGERLFRFTTGLASERDPVAARGCWWVRRPGVRRIVADAVSRGVELAPAAQMGLGLASAFKNQADALVIAEVKLELAAVRGRGRLVSARAEDGAITGIGSGGTIEDGFLASNASWSASRSGPRDHVLPDPRIEQLYIPGLARSEWLAETTLRVLRVISVPDFWAAHRGSFASDIMAVLDR